MLWCVRTTIGIDEGLLAEATRRAAAVFGRLCRGDGAKSNPVRDAYLAPPAVESGGEWITTDGDLSRFPGLRWRHPFAAR